MGGMQILSILRGILLGWLKQKKSDVFSFSIFPFTLFFSKIYNGVLLKGPWVLPEVWRLRWRRLWSKMSCQSTALFQKAFLKNSRFLRPSTSWERKKSPCGRILGTEGGYFGSLNGWVVDVRIDGAYCELRKSTQMYEAFNLHVNCHWRFSIVFIGTPTWSSRSILGDAKTWTMRWAWRSFPMATCSLAFTSPTSRTSSNPEASPT